METKRRYFLRNRSLRKQNVNQGDSARGRRGRGLGVSASPRSERNGNASNEAGLETSARCLKYSFILRRLNIPVDDNNRKKRKSRKKTQENTCDSSKDSPKVCHDTSREILSGETCLDESGENLNEQIQCEESPIFRVPLPLKFQGSSTSSRSSETTPNIRSADSFLHSPSLGTFLSEISSQELPQLQLTPNLGLGTPRYAIAPTSTPSFSRFDMQMIESPVSVIPNRDIDCGPAMPMTPLLMLASSPPLPCTPLLQQCEASLGVPIEAISTPFLTNSFTEGATAGPDLLELIDDDKESVHNLDKNITNYERDGNLNLMKTEKPRNALVKVEESHWKRETPCAYSNLCLKNKIKIQKPPGRYSKVMSHELLEALKARQRVREHERKKKLQEKGRATEEEITRKIINHSGRRTRSMSGTLIA